MNRMSLFEWLLNEFLAYYKITSRSVSPISAMTQESLFDLSDSAVSLGRILPARVGDVSFKNQGGIVEVVWYNDFVNQCNKPDSFQKGRRRCDFLMNASSSGSKSICLVEVTTAKDEVALFQPIGDNSHWYALGKFEKCEIQLFESLKTLLAVNGFEQHVSSCNKRCCIMAYHLKQSSIQKDGVTLRFPQARYLRVESRIPGGAIISSPDINVLGFEYVRLSHDQVFSLL